MLIESHQPTRRVSLAYQGNADLGPKFVDMSEPYSSLLQEKA